MVSPYDAVGALLPQALRLARYQASATLPQNIDDLESENDTINKSPSREELRLLVHNANVVHALEDLFSRSEKNRVLKTSQLSRIESVRFQRAMYRFWLMSVLFGPRRFPLWRNFSDEDLDREADLRESQKDQKAFLRQFSSQELLQIRKVMQFIATTANRAVTAAGSGLGGTPYDWDGMFLFAGPHVVLRCFEDANMDYLPTDYIHDDGPYTKFLTCAYSEITRERQMMDPPVSCIGVILDSVDGEGDRCQHCGGNGNFFPSDERVFPMLFNVNNWDELKGWLEKEDVLTSNVSHNLVEKPLLRALDCDWPKLLNDVFPYRRDQYAKWCMADLVCFWCLLSFLRDTLFHRRLKQKKKAGEAIATDCRSGYNCEEQCYERGLAHAQKFNHLCEPNYS